MEDMAYTARLVVSKGYQDRLDMSITCENAQQLLRARNMISDQLNTYIAEFAIQSGLNATTANDPNGEALQEVIEESVEKAKAAAEETEDPDEVPEEDQTAESPDDESGEDAAEEPQTEESAPVPEPPPLVTKKPKPQKPQAPIGTKGLLKLRCQGCGENFLAFLRERQVTWVCKDCGHVIPLTNTALFEFDCPTCGKHTFGRTNIEDADLTFPCGGCNTEVKLTWNPKAKKYME